jgi:hypothetical protein
MGEGKGVEDVRLTYPHEVEGFEQSKGRASVVGQLGHAMPHHVQARLGKEGRQKGDGQSCEVQSVQRRGGGGSVGSGAYLSCRGHDLSLLELGGRLFEEGSDLLEVRHLRTQYTDDSTALSLQLQI